MQEKIEKMFYMQRFFFFLYKYLDADYEIQVVISSITHKIFNNLPSTWSYAQVYF